jgi:hypothetical protein
MSMRDCDNESSGHIVQVLEFLGNRYTTFKSLPHSLGLVRRINLNIEINHRSEFDTATSNIVNILLSQAQSLQELRVSMTVSSKWDKLGHKCLCRYGCIYEWVYNRIEQDSLALLDLVEKGVKVYCEDWHQAEFRHDMTECYHENETIKIMEAVVVSAREDALEVLGLLREKNSSVEDTKWLQKVRGEKRGTAESSGRYCTGLIMNDHDVQTHLRSFGM